VGAGACVPEPEPLPVPVPWAACAEGLAAPPEPHPAATHSALCPRADAETERGAGADAVWGAVEAGDVARAVEDRCSGACERIIGQTSELALRGVSPF
jgi:hypothetical protein